MFTCCNHTQEHHASLVCLASSHSSGSRPAVPANDHAPRAASLPAHPHNTTRHPSARGIALASATLQHTIYLCPLARYTNNVCAARPPSAPSRNCPGIVERQATSCRRAAVCIANAIRSGITRPACPLPAAVTISLRSPRSQTPSTRRACIGRPSPSPSPFHLRHR